MLMSQSSQFQNAIVGGSTPRGLGLVPVGMGTDGNSVYTASSYDDTSSMFIAGHAPDGTPLWSWNASANVQSITDPSLAGNAGGQSSSVFPAVTGLLDKIFGAYNTVETIDLNKQRLAAGLQPVTPSALAPTVNVGVSTQTLFMLGIGAVALMMLGKKRR